MRDRERGKDIGRGLKGGSEWMREGSKLWPSVSMAWVSELITNYRSVEMIPFDKREAR
jgi:hypothetical protein